MGGFGPSNDWVVLDLGTVVWFLACQGLGGFGPVKGWVVLGLSRVGWFLDLSTVEGFWACQELDCFRPVDS